MTVLLVQSPQSYIGLAADAKPTAGVVAGAYFWELDTGKTSRYDGAAWQFSAPIGGSGGTLAAGSAIIGKVGIDQTTPGTTNAVSVTQQPVYLAPVSGELIGVTAATQLPNVPCRMVRFKASYNNTARVYLGIAGVTKAAGSTSTTAGLQLNAGDDTGWIPVDNLSRFYRIADDVNSHLTYLACN